MSGPTYTYTATTPLAPDPFNSTQNPILNNFRAINELFAVNHIGFNNSNTGLHTFLSTPFQATPPDTAATDMAVFSQSTPSGPNASELYYRFPSNGQIVQMSEVNTPTDDPTTPSGSAGTGWCLMSDSGMLIKWGSATITVNAQNSSNSNNVTTFYLPTGSGIPAYTKAILFTQIALLNNTSGSNVFSGLGAYAFYGGNHPTTYITLEQVSTSAITITFNWITIGV